MRPRKLTLAVVAVLLGVPLLAAPASAKPVSKAHGDVSAGAVSLAFHVRNEAAPQGSFTLTTPERKLTVKVVCYVQDGNRALIMGNITEHIAYKFAPLNENDYLIRVEDNGEGRKAAPDRFSHASTDLHLVPRFGCPTSAANDSTPEWAKHVVDRGNIQLHR